MATATHAYVVWFGSFLDHPEEYWQVGLRYGLWNSVAAPALSGSLPTFDVSEVDEGSDETDWVISSKWNGNLGVGSTLSVHDWLNEQLGPAGLLLLSGCYISSQVNLHGVKASPINGSGHVVGLRTAQLLYKSPLPHGPTDIPMLPAECSVAVSWITPVVGRRGRGRIYLPPTGSAILAEDGNLGTSQTSHIATGAAAFVEATKVTPPPLVPSTEWALPVVTGSPYTAYGQLVGCRVGSVVDSQRRRRRSMSEVYSAATIT